jgi:DNA-directed RNA polymerase
MSSIQEIEEAIANLPREDFLRLRDRIQQRFEDEWDRQFKEDVVSGRLEQLGEQALSEHRAGNSTPFPDNAE